MVSVPEQRLDPRALALWRLSGAIGAVVVLAGVGLGLALAFRLGWPRPVVIALATLLALAAISGVWPIPDLTWRSWRYQVREADVDLQWGWWTVNRVRIPMARIQHVDTRRGPLERRFGLATLVLYTAAGANEIPALAEAAAAEARDRIAALANLADDL